MILIGPPYSHKALIMFHIIQVCQRINYNQSLIHFYIDKQCVSEEKFLQSITYVELSNEDLDKENALIGLAVPAFQAGFQTEYLEMARKQNIEDGYKAIAKIFVKGKE
jgi:hypothetical protein